MATEQKVQVGHTQFGIFTAAVGSGQLVFLPLTAALIEKFGWRMALWPSMGFLILVAAAVLLLLRELSLLLHFVEHLGELLEELLALPALLRLLAELFELF